MGNIYYEQGKLPQAIKHYRMALDQVPITHKEMRFDINSLLFYSKHDYFIATVLLNSSLSFTILIRIKIMQNIGVAFVELNQYADAVTSFEQVMSDSPSLSSGRYISKRNAT